MQSRKQYELHGAVTGTLVLYDHCDDCDCDSRISVVLCFSISNNAETSQQSALK
jgi:hypothetical protein